MDTTRFNPFLRWGTRLCACAVAPLLAPTLALSLTGDAGYSRTVSVAAPWSAEWALEEGAAFDISLQLVEPSGLPPNARIEVRWSGPELPNSGFAGDRGDPSVIATADWSKVLHALDPDLHLVYRAPVSGTYSIRLEPVLDREQPLGPIPHDTGLAPLATPLPTVTPAVDGADVAIRIRPVTSLSSGSLVLEAEPNNAPEQATVLQFGEADETGTLYVVGGADDIEYYNNTSTGNTPDDWYRIEYQGTAPKYLSANLQIVEPVVSARIRFYRQGRPSAEELRERDVPNSRDFSNFNPIPYVHPPATVVDGPVPVYTYEQGRAINERAHQQDRSFRTFVTRQLEPGQTYYLRVEANQPHYELQVRLFDPAPYTDPVQAVRQAVYYHLAEIDAWLIHRPRNIAPHRRVRDATALFGENCMSCHTQSGVWGVADAFRNGYGPRGVEQNYRRLVNTMYESLRLTNELKDAAVNTSVAPNDLGDGPAGTRVAGRNIVLHERTHEPKQVHAQWQRRTANYVLQTADPKGINAAGRGSNFGPNVVFKFAAEVLERSWRDSGEPRYFFGIEEKGRKILATGDDIRVTDDFGHRVEFVHRIWPSDYVEQVRKLTNSPRRIAEAERLDADLRARAAIDLSRILTLQREDGGWGFNAGKAGENGEWVRPDDHSYPAATAVALIALEAAGYTADDPVVERGVRWLLDNQYPYGLWNAAAATGFVTSAYVIRALSRLHPAPEAAPDQEFAVAAEEGFLESLAKARAAQAAARPEHTELFKQFTGSAFPQVRYYGLLALGGALAHDAVPTLIKHFDDPVKSCREAAFWSMRQLLLDGGAWGELFEAYRNGTDRARQSVMHALVTRAHLPGSGVNVDLSELAGILTAGMVDPHPGVRAYAFKAAWHWWVWNPPMREPINQAWIDALLREEPEAHVDMALRYSTISLFIVNGQVNNITREEFAAQQYPELAPLFSELLEWRETAPPERRRLLDRRLTAMAASHYMERANQQSPGQFAYSTPGATELFGKAVLAVYQDQAQADVPWRSIALEGARGVTHKPLQDTILSLLQTADPSIVAIAARALANPGELSLPGRRGTLAPLLEVLRLYADTDREDEADALAGFLARVKWDFDGLSEADEAEFYRLLLDLSSPRAAAGTPASAVLGKPAPTEALTLEESPYAPLVARILGENRSLHRKQAFSHLSADPRLWLDSTEWMLAFREGGETVAEAVAGAVEAEDLEVAALTFGRTTDQAIPGGVASGNSGLIWEEGKVGAHISYSVPVPQPGKYELLGAILHGASHGIVRIEFDGELVLDQADFYRDEVTSTGPMRMGVFDLSGARALLKVTMLGTNAEAEPEFKFGLDYVKLTPWEGAQSQFTTDESGVEVIDPIAAAKRQVVGMFVRWFSPDSSVETRELAAKLASSPALRRNPEVRKAIVAHVENETVNTIRNRLKNLLASDDERYGEELRKLIGARDERDGPRLEASDEFVQDVLYFRDHVFTEMNRISERDGRACISCHGVPGRVPTLYLNPPDDAGHIEAAELLGNYRKLQARVDLEDPERSLILRKPLNLQTGQEEGHQGGVRYEAEDAGYATLHEWVLRQVDLQAAPR
ncbi:MAG: hypothetical protein OXN96_01340 [Bryobacterales bacterium]|nr:hypothetical protein [Bryobacterales bacterium]